VNDYAIRARPAQTVGLIIVDEVEGSPWGPTVPDTTTFQGAIQVLKKYTLLDAVSVYVRKHLEKGGPGQETPEATNFQLEKVKVQNLVLANSELLCEAAQKRADELGWNAMILSGKSEIELEKEEYGIRLLK
jgi:glycerate 2-kinase